jgi:hypothetical protein
MAGRTTSDRAPCLYVKRIHRFGACPLAAEIAVTIVHTETMVQRGTAWGRTAEEAGP